MLVHAFKLFRNHNKVCAICCKQSKNDRFGYIAKVGITIDYCSILATA